MSKVEVRHHNATAEGFGMALLAVVALFGAVLATPGAVVVFAVDRAVDLRLDCAQLWTFAIVSTVVMIVAFSIGPRSVLTGVARFLALAVIVAGLLLVARFGFHASWPRDLWRAFTGYV